MKHEKIGASAPKNADPGMLAGSSVSIVETGENRNLKAALTATSPSGVTVHKDRQFGYLLGNPQVIVERRNGSAFVSVRPRPWGWDVDCEWLNPNSPAIDRYVLALLGRIHDEGKKEYQRRERIKALRQAEREAAR